jgi:hypothetical protein
MHFEHRRQPILQRQAFARRLATNFAASMTFIGASLCVGMIGYTATEGMEWIDAFANAAMILSGMGPLAPLHTFSGKLFAGCYALYSGLAVVFASGLILAPIFHRILHRFHVPTEENGGRDFE